MVFFLAPLLLPLALIASSAIMVAPYASEEIKKQQEAKEVIDKGYSDRIELQSVGLQGTDSLLVANPDDPTTTKAITQQSWFIPLVFAGAAFVMFVVLRK